MKELNKFTHNRLAYILELLIENKWVEFGHLINENWFYGHDWDKAIPDSDNTEVRHYETYKEAVLKKL